MSELNLKQVLIIDDSADFRNLLLKFFGKVFPNATLDVYDPADGKPSETFNWDKYNLIILDYDLGNGENGLEWLRLYKVSSNFPPVIMLTAQGNEETVVNAFRYGAQDYLKKDGLTKGRLLESVERALDKHQEESKKADTQQLRVHIYNKEKFYRSLESVNKSDLMILAEVDKFQQLRDDHGMMVADKIANFTSEKISQYIAGSSFTGEMTRIGDSSVAMLIRSYQDDDQGKVICEQICKTFGEKSFQEDGKTLEFYLNIASVYLSTDQTDTDTILKQADIACRSARDKSGHSFVTTEVSDNQNTETETEGNNELDAQLENVFIENRVKPLYQSFIKLSSLESEIENLEYYQVRINLLGKDENTIEAREFIPALRRKSLLKDMDRWVISSCIAQLAASKAEEHNNPGFFISLTEESLTDILFAKWLESELFVHELSSANSALVLEITAENYLKFQKQTAFLIKTLGKKHNILFALSDVSGKNTLAKCLADKVKFDFVMFAPFEGTDNAQNKDIEDVVSLCKEHDCLSIATKIENNDAMVTSMSCNIDFISGYFLQPPQENLTGTEVVEV